MAQLPLSTEESTMFEIIKILREDNKISLVDMASLDNMARLIRHTDHKTRIHFDHVFAAIQAGQTSTRLRTAVPPEQQALWSEFAAIETSTSNDTYAGACESAAKLIAETWIDYPRPGTEQPYTPGHHNGIRKRRLVCNDSFQCAAILVQKMEAAPRTIQNQRWIYTIADLLGKLCWYYYELSNYTEASFCADRAIQICESAMKQMLVFQEYAKRLVLLSDMQQARAVIACELGDVQTAVAFGQKQIGTATAATGFAPQAKTTELARAYMVMGNIMIIDHQCAAAEAYFNQAVPVLKALPRYHKLQMYTILHGLGWTHLLKREYQKARDYFSEALLDREAAYGIDDIEGVQTGELLYALGTVAAVREEMLDGYSYHRRSCGLLEQAVGTALHWNVAKAMYKIAGHYIRELDWNSAYIFLTQCDDYYKTAPHFTGMRARVQFHLSRVHKGLENFSKARKAWDLAYSLRKSLRPDDERRPGQLDRRSYDELVVPWCR